MLPKKEMGVLRSCGSLSAFCSAPGPLHSRSGWWRSISRLCPIPCQASLAQLAVAWSCSAPLSRPCSLGLVACQLAWSGLLGQLGCYRAQPLSPACSQTLCCKGDCHKALCQGGDICHKGAIPARYHCWVSSIPPIMQGPGSAFSWADDSMGHGHGQV